MAMYRNPKMSFTSAPRRPRRPATIQAKHDEQDSALATKYSCSNCGITYYASTPKCPMCSLQKDNDELRKALLETKNKLEAMTNKVSGLSEQVDQAVAIKNALPLLDENDRHFFKSILYQWKIDRSVQLKLTYGRAHGHKATPNGFIAIFRGAEPAAHHCTSMGGVAIAEYYQEALRSVGTQHAMNALLRGFVDLLPGAIK